MRHRWLAGFAGLVVGLSTLTAAPAGTASATPTSTAASSNTLPRITTLTGPSSPYVQPGVDPVTGDLIFVESGDLRRRDQAAGVRIVAPGAALVAGLPSQLAEATPQAVAVTGDGRMVVGLCTAGAAQACVLREVSAEGAVTTLAGGGEGELTHGAPALSVRLPAAARLVGDGDEVLVTPSAGLTDSVWRLHDGVWQRLAGSGEIAPAAGVPATQAKLSLNWAGRHPDGRLLLSMLHPNSNSLWAVDAEGLLETVPAPGGAPYNAVTSDGVVWSIGWLGLQRTAPGGPTTTVINGAALTAGGITSLGPLVAHGAGLVAAAAHGGGRFSNLHIDPSSNGPSAPTDVRLDLRDRRLVLSWSAAPDHGPGTTYAYRHGENGAWQPVPPGVWSVTFDNLSYGERQHFHVIALTKDGWSWPPGGGSVMPFDVIPPPPATALRAVPAGGEITFSWAGHGDTFDVVVVGKKGRVAPRSIKDGVGACASILASTCRTRLHPNTYDDQTFVAFARDRVGNISAASPAVTIRGTRMVVTISDRTPRYGRTLAITGRLTTPDGSPVAGRRVQLREGAWSPEGRVLAVGTTGRRGRVLFKRKMTGSEAHYTLTTADGGSYFGAWNSSPKATVQSVVTTRLAQRTNRFGQRVVVITGTVRPAVGGGSVLVQKWHRGRWRWDTSADLSRTGRYHANRIPGRGTHRYRVVDQSRGRNYVGPARRITVR